MSKEMDLAMDEYSISELQEMMASSRTSARAITELYLRRIDEIDRHGPSLNSVLELNPDALSMATTLDDERAKGQVRGPLHGIPVLLKGNIDTADKMTTTAGSLALEGSVAAEDAHLVKRLREAGAVILGKTNLSEWANFRSPHSSSGWSSQGGQTLNPYALDRNPCGSSSGSAVAVAANLCSVAVGTETDGSIVCPANANGIVGIKPTVGLVSRSGIIPISHSQDTAGPMARSVTDAAILLSALAGEDERDPVTAQSRRRPEESYMDFLDANGLEGARIGVARSFFNADPKVDEIMESCLERMGELGAVLVDTVEVEVATEMRQAEIEVLLYEFKAGLNAYLAKLGPGAPVRSLEGVIAFNQDERERTMPFFGQERMLSAQEKGPLTDDSYRRNLETSRRLAAVEGIDLALERHELDAIVAPTGSPAWLIDLINGDHRGVSSSSPAAIAGYPNITVPAGYIHGLPVNISFFASAYQESTLLRVAYAFEQATLARRPPQFLPTADLSQIELS